LQAALIGHGGYTALGVNTCVMTFPALITASLFAALHRVPALRRPAGRAILVAGVVVLWGLSVLVGIELTLAERRGAFKDWFSHPARWWSLHPFTLAALGFTGSLAAWWERRLENAPDFPLGLLVGEVAVLLSVALNALVLGLALPDGAG